MQSKTCYGFAKEQIEDFRKELEKCLRDFKDDNGNNYLSEDDIKAYTGYEDENIADLMRYQTPQSWAEMIVM